MATVRAQRLLNNIINGTTNSTALETALGTSSIRADFQQVVNERSKARLITSTTNGAAAVGQSATATTDFFESPPAVAEFGKNTSKLSQYIGPSIGGSNSLMNTFTSNNGNLTAAANIQVLGGPIHTSIFAKNYASRFLSGTTTSVAWNLPSVTNVSPFNASPRFWGANGLTIMFSFQGASFQNAQAVSISTDGGLTFPTRQPIDASNASAVRDLSYGNNLWVACGDSSNLYTSPNGTTWTKITGIGGQHDKVRYANGRWILLGQSQNYYSTDGITWTLATGSTSGQAFYDLQYVGNNTWLACYNSVNVLRSVNNGNSWTTVSTGNTNFSIASDLTGNVVTGRDAGSYTYSTNYGQSWTTGTQLNGLNGGLSTYGAIYYGGNFIFANQSASQLSYLRTVGGTSFSMTPNSALGVNPVPFLGTLSDPSQLRVVDGRLFSSVNTSTFYVGNAGQ